MAQTCQHCGATTDDDNRVMCPSCGRRMRPATGADAPLPPSAPPPSPYGPPPGSAPAPSPYGPPPGSAPAPSAYISGEPAYAPYATAESAWPSQAGPPGVEMRFSRAAIARTSRVKVAFRLILVFPHVVALWALGYALGAVTVVAWFAALFTARVPEGIYGFIGWVVRYGARVLAYVWLLTDRWPTFSESPDDPVQVELPGPTRLNRAAVLFRIVLLIPTAIVAGLLGFGLAVAAFFVWLVVLVMGRVPQPVFDATASAVRYQTRYYAYGTLLTARYPGGLYGDAGGPTDTSAASEGVAPPVLSAGARRMVAAFLVLGVLGAIGYGVLLSRLADPSAKALAADDNLTSAYQAVHMSDPRTCVGARNSLGCYRESASRDAETLRTFREDVANIDFPSDSAVQDDASSVLQLTDTLVSDFEQLSSATTTQDYQNFASGADIPKVQQDLGDAVHQLSVDLDSLVVAP